MSIKLLGNYNNGGPTSFGSILEIYGLSRPDRADRQRSRGNSFRARKENWQIIEVQNLAAVRGFVFFKMKFLVYANFRGSNKVFTVVINKPTGAIVTSNSN